jgi:predicted transcriptional regulator
LAKAQDMPAKLPQRKLQLMEALLNKGTRIQNVAEEVKCSCRPVQYYKANIRDTGKIEKEVHGNRGSPLPLTQEMRQVHVLFH